MGKLAGKVAVVTGASKGIGTGIALEFGAEGAVVVATYSSDEAGAKRAVDEIVSKGGKAIAVRADMSKPEDIERLFKEIWEQFGTLDVLVNNAGLYDFGPLESVTPEGFTKHFNLNVLGPILAAKEAVSLFGEKGGSIINITSIVALNPPPFTLVYSATKAALDNVTSYLANELGPKNIRVNSILPGMTITEGLSRVGAAESEMGSAMLAATPLGRHGQPKDIAKVALFLASEDSAWVTGEAIRVSGGLH